MNAPYWTIKFIDENIKLFFSGPKAHLSFNCVFIKIFSLFLTFILKNYYTIQNKKSYFSKYQFFFISHSKYPLYQTMKIIKTKSKYVVARTKTTLNFTWNTTDKYLFIVLYIRFNWNSKCIFQTEVKMHLSNENIINNKRTKTNCWWKNIAHIWKWQICFSFLCLNISAYSFNFSTRQQIRIKVQIFLVLKKSGYNISTNSCSCLFIYLFCKNNLQNKITRRDGKAVT